MMNTVTTKRIFNKTIALYLLNKGFEIINVETHKDNPQWLIFHFHDTADFRREFTKLTNEIKMNKPI